MSNAVATGAFPGMYEHVTKMGRVGKNHKGPHIGRNAGPQFRKLPYQDQPIQSPVPSSTPRRGSPVMRMDDENDFLKFPDIVTQPRTRPAADSTPYVEMKLGRNMRAAPKGKLAAMSIDANTQDLIETLNRNNLTSLTQQTQQTEQTNLQEEQRRAAERQERLEASLRSLQEEERRRQDEEETREKQRKSEEEQKLARDFETKNTLLYDAFELTEPKTVVSPVMATPMMGVATPLMGVATPPPPADLYSSYRMTENYEQKSSEHVSTQPFSPHESTYFSRGGETTTTTTTSLKEDNSGFTGPKSAAVKREDSTDDNIEEIIEENNDKSDDDKIKDDDFDF